MRYTDKYPKLKCQLLSENAYLPERATIGSSGLDVFSPIACILPAHKDILIPLDIRFEIPWGWDLSVYNKSGRAIYNKVCKGAELIDSDFYGNCIIHLFNFSSSNVYINKGDKIAQLVMRRVWMGEIEQTESIIIKGERRENGFGSTGI